MILSFMVFEFDIPIIFLKKKGGGVLVQHQNNWTTPKEAGST
jgi:hypothetical protein